MEVDGRCLSFWRKISARLKLHVSARTAFAAQYISEWLAFAYCLGGGIGDADTRNTGDKESYERQMKFISDTYLSMFASPQEVITAMLFSDTHEKLAGKPGGKLFAAYVVNLTLEEDPPQFVSHGAIAFIDHLLQGGKTKVWPLTSLSMSPVSPMCCPYLTHLYITLCFTILR